MGLMRRVFVLLLITLMYLSWVSAQDANAGACAGSLTSRLAVGGVGRVLPGEPNNLRVNPTTDARRIGQIKAGETFTIEDGPVCADGYTWWQVDLRGLVGWTTESGDGEYWLEMITAPAPVIAEGDCPGSLASRLAIGDQVRVRPPKANNVRETPSVNAKVLYKLPVGGSAILLNGPVCADGYTWWQIEDLGWTAESGDGEYWLEEFNSAPVILSPVATRTLNTALLTPSVTVAPSLTPESAAVPELNSGLPPGIAVEPLWTETFDDNSTGWNVIPFEGYTDEFLFREIKDGGYTMSRTHSSTLMQDWDGLFLQEIAGLPDSLDQYVLSVDVQSLTPESQSQCAVLQVNLDVSEQAVLFFCRGGLVSGGWLANPSRQQSTDGSVLTSLPDVMDGAVHRVTVISDGQTLSSSIDGQAGLTFAYEFPLNSFGLSYYDFDQASTINLAVRFDTVEIGRPTFDSASVLPTPTLATPVPATQVPPGPHATSSAEANIANPIPPNTVPVVYNTIRRVPVWQETFDDHENGWHPVSEASQRREIQEGRYVMSSTKGGPKEDRDVFIMEDEWNLRYEYMISVDVQTLTPDSPSACAVLLINAKVGDHPMSIYYCRGGFISLVDDPYDARDFDESTQTYLSKAVLMEGLPDAMDGAVHRLAAVVNGRTIRLYIDGQGGIESSYTDRWTSVGIGYSDFGDARPGLTLAFDNLDVSIPTTCTLTVIVTPLEMSVTQQEALPAVAEASINFDYRYYQDWAVHSSAGHWIPITDLQVRAGDRVTGFPPLTGTAGCSRKTSVVLSLYEQQQFVDFYALHLSENAWQEGPREATATFASQQGLIYTVTYRVEFKQDNGTPLPLKKPDLSGITVKPGMP